MSLIVKIALPVLIAIAAIWGYISYTHPQSDTMADSDYTIQQAQDGQPAAGNNSAASQVSARGTTDTALDADLNAIDAQLQAASDSSASIDSGLNDEAGNTSY